MADLAGHNAVVTGGSRGIGRAIARVLKEAGCRVTILGRTQSALDEAVAAGVADAAIMADVSDGALLNARLAAAAIERPIDILVNNAGSALSKPFEKHDPALFGAMIAQHLYAPAEAIRAVLPGMKDRGWGRIINIGSTASLKGYSHFAAYVAAKHALLGLTRALALEVARTGITVNCICPGFTETDLVMGGMSARAAKEGREAAELAREFAATKPMGRLVNPGEVAAAALWLVSEGAASVTGQAIIVDGGEMIS